MRNRIPALTLLLACVPAPPAAAQFTQYLPPGSFEDDFASMEKALEAAVLDARWRVGPVHLDPWVSLREVSYDDNVGNRPRDPVADLLVKVGAGVRGYLPVGEDLIVAGHALPEYVWWRDSAERRRVDGRYGVGLFGSAGPVDLEVSAQHIEDARFFSRELEDRVDTEEAALIASFEVGVGRGFSLFARGGFHSYRFLPEADRAGLPDVGALDRDETVARAGLRFRPRPNLMIGVGVEASQATFASSLPGPANSGTAPVLELDYGGSRLTFASDLAWRSLEADGDGPFPAYDEVSGSFRAAWQVTGPLQLEVLGSRNLVYSLLDNYAYFTDQSLAAGVGVSFGSRVGLRVRLEEGSNDYAALTPEARARVDDFTGLHGEVQIDLGPLLLVVSGSETEYDSNLTEFDRTVTTISTGLVFGARKQSPWG